jgi:LPS export ABC transporter protein LptC
MRLSSVRIILFSLTLAVLALWITTKHYAQKQSTQSSQVNADSYSWQSIDSTTWKINRNEPNQQTTLQTKSFRYHESLKKSDFTQPIITHSQPNNVVIITSQQGQSLKDELITLSGNVIIKQISTESALPEGQQGNKTQNSILSTEHITYNASNGELQTDAKVLLTQPNSSTTATGLKANLETGQYQLLNDVQGIYYINQPLKETKSQ